MYNETKIAVKKAFEIGKILFSMSDERYKELLFVISRIKPPTIMDLEPYMEDGLSMEDALITILKDKYKQTALDAGFTEKQGLAMLEYASLYEEIKDEEIQSYS